MIILQYHEVFQATALRPGQPLALSEPETTDLLAAPAALSGHLGADSLKKTSWYHNVIISLGSG